MDNDRYNRDTRRNDFHTENTRYGSSGESRRNADYGSDRDQGSYRSRDEGRWSREDSRRQYGGGNFYGANRDDYASGNQDSSFASDHSYNSDRGGYDEWSRRGDRSFGDRYSTREGYGGFYGGSDRGDYERDRNRGYGGQTGASRWSSGRSYGGGERGYSEGGRGFWDKASDEVSSWFGDRDAERRREQDQHRGRGPKGYSRSDERIKEDVNDRLTDDGWLDASNIDVSVKDREVTLSGTVSDRNAKRRAEDIAEGVSGVAHVQNNIRVKSNDATSTTVDVDRPATEGMVAKSSAGGQR